MAILHHNRTEDSNDDVLRKLDACLRLLADWEVGVPPESRFNKYRARMADLMSSPLGMVPELELHQHQFDYREIDEFLAIMAGFKTKPPPVVLERLRTMISGHEGPDDEPTSAGRDAQWELYLLSLLRRDGIPAFLGNPDVRARILDSDVPIEAKRPKLEARLDDRLRKGVSQIECAENAGIIAFSLDRAIRQGRGILTGASTPVVEAEVLRLVRELVNRQLRPIISRVKGRRVLGLIFHARMPTLAEDSGQFRLVSHGHLEPVYDAGDGRAILARVMDALAKA